MEPRSTAKLNFDSRDQRATVALLSVDKAFYALKADNQLTAKQVKLLHTNFMQTFCIHLLSISSVYVLKCSTTKLLFPYLQVFSDMQSYDLGCSYGGGADSPSVLLDAGLSFVSQADSKWRMGTRKLSYIIKLSLV